MTVEAVMTVGPRAAAALLLGACMVARAASTWWRHRRRLAPELWPWVIDELRRHGTAGDGGLPTALIGVGLHGPPPMRRAAHAALVAHRRGADAAAVYRRFAGALNDPCADRVCTALRDADVVGADQLRVLDALRSVAVDVAAQQRAVERERSGARAARWVAVAPAVLVWTVASGAAAGVVAVVCAAAWGLVEVVAAVGARAATAHGRVLDTPGATAVTGARR
jgi:hypothetical protein